MDRNRGDGVMDEEEKSARSRSYIESSSIFDPHGMRVVRSSSICTAMRQRSYTDPTDLLAVFRRRISTLDENHNIPCTRDRTSSDREFATNVTTISVELSSVVPALDLEQELLQKSSNESLSTRGMKNSSLNSRISSDMDSTPKDINDSPPAERPTLRERKVSAPAYRVGRRNSQVVLQFNAQRRCSVAYPPRRTGRRGSEVPALSSLARKRSTLTPAYPVGLKGRGARGFSNAEFHLNNIQVKAKHEMLANLVLPVFNENAFRTRERRTTCGCHPAAVLTKKDEKRLHVTNEILHTEKKYLACLNTLKIIFEDPLREENLLGVKEIDIIFPSELDLIRDSHTLFMNELEDRVQNWKQYGIVGDIFTKLSSSYHIDVLKIYSDYVNNFPKAIAVINKYSRGSQKFRRFLQNCSAEPECEGLDLAAYLLTPIQRLPRYVLLLRQLSKCTDASHPDSFHLENALETMKNMINILNDSIHNSCKIVSTSISRKSVKRRSLGKKKSLKELKIVKDDNDNNRIVHTKCSSVTDSVKSPNSPPMYPISVLSIPGVESPVSSPSSPQESSPQDDRHSTGSERSILTRLRSSEKKSRPVSTGDLDQFYNVDNAKEFHDAIVEEGEGKDDKTSGQSKIKSAAESVKRSWQRRSKKWRRSFEGRAISTNALPELGNEDGHSKLTFTHSAEKFRFDHNASASKSQTISPVPSIESAQTMDDSILDESDGNPCTSISFAISTNESLETGLERTEESKRIIPNVGTISEQDDLVLRAFPNGGSPYTKHKKLQRKIGVQERPLSVALPMKIEAETSENILEDKSKSDNDIFNSEDVPIWIHRQHHPHLQQRHSDGLLRHMIRRKSSTLSSDRTSETTGTSVGSLDTSKDSMIDSGVSGDTQNDSPINTSENPPKNMENFTQLSAKERLVFDEVIASGFKDNHRKKSQNEHEEKVKNKRRLKDVVKHMFSKTKKKSGSTVDDSVQQRPKSKILTRSKSLNVRASKDHITSPV